jgi:hypothetical protein
MSRQIEFGWKAHDTQGEWTAKVDVKASILLASQVGLLLVAAAVASSKELTVTPLVGGLALIGLALLIASGVATASAVYPILERSPEQGFDLLYFGDVRRMSDEQVIQGIEQMSGEEELESLARQLTRMSRGNWRKHRLLQVSIWLMGAAVMCGFVALLLAG